MRDAQEFFGQAEDGIRDAQESCGQAEDGIRDAQESRGLGDVYKRQEIVSFVMPESERWCLYVLAIMATITCLLYTSDAADDLTRVDLGGRRIIKKQRRTRPARAAPRPTDRAACNARQ